MSGVGSILAMKSFAGVVRKRKAFQAVVDRTRG